MTVRFITAVTTALATLAFSNFAFSEQTDLEKAKVMRNEAMNATKKKFRNAKNELCEYVEGELQCLAEKTANKARNIKDDAKAKTSEIKDKID